MMKSKADEEDYWNSSKFKAFTFDDEDDEFTKLKESRQAVNSICGLVEEEEDEDEVEKVSWSGEPVGSEGISRFLSDSETGSGASASSPCVSCFLLPVSCRYLVVGQGDGVQPARAELPQDRHDAVAAVSLEKFRSLQEKLLLLDEAVGVHDGNVITAVLIYLKKSLSKEVLFRELESRQTALRHFIHYLTETLMLFPVCLHGDRQLLQYKEHLRITDENKRRDFLKSCVSLPFSPEDAGHVQDHYTLLERQIIIEATDRQAETGGKVEIFQKFPRRASILNMPLITTLYYCCFYHYAETEGTYSSPANIRQTFRIAEKQYFVTALAARAKLKAWHDVDALFTSRNWLGFTRKKSPLSFSRVADILSKNNAPVQVLQEYVGLVDDVELRVALAQKYKCHFIVISTYRDLKDRQLLLGYRGKVERGSEEERKIDELLSNPQIRWKN
uniref:Spermatogenesis-defective protein 39 homolog n=1 Tax=Myripristis murdjan TaxID=586833 RepID=A0A667XSU0_9TELE